MLSEASGFDLSEVWLQRQLGASEEGNLQLDLGEDGNEGVDERAGAIGNRVGTSSAGCAPFQRRCSRTGSRG